MSVLATPDADGRYQVIGLGTTPLTPAHIIRGHLTGSGKVAMTAWVRPLSLGAVTGDSRNRVFTAHIGPGTTGLTFGFNPDGSAWAGGRSFFNSSPDQFYQATSTLKIPADEIGQSWHLIGMVADYGNKTISVFLDGQWTTAAAPLWQSSLLSTNYNPSSGAAPNEQSFDGIGAFHTSTVKYATIPYTTFHGYVAHLWVPRFHVPNQGAVLGYNTIAPYASNDVLTKMWRDRLSPQAFMTPMRSLMSYGYWPLSSGANIPGPRYGAGDPMIMTPVGGGLYHSDPALRHVLRMPGIRRFYSLPALPTLSLPTYVPGSLTATGFRPRVTVT